MVYDGLSGVPITASRIFDGAVGIGLSFIAITNPVGLILLGGYAVLDAYGAFNGLKSSLGGDGNY